jgi:hypothetical protein
MSIEEACRRQYGISEVQARLTDLNEAFTRV